MSDFSISIVPRISAYPGKEEKAQEILDWLLSLDIIKPQTAQDLLELRGAYSVSHGAKSMVKKPQDLPFEYRSTIFEIELERMVFGTWQYGVTSLTCPACKENIVEMAFEFAESWYEKKQAKLICPRCGNADDIHGYTFNPCWGFSDLGFTFKAWTEFREDFLQAFQNKLGIEIDVVETRI